MGRFESRRPRLPFAGSGPAQRIVARPDLNRPVPYFFLGNQFSVFIFTCEFVKSTKNSLHVQKL
jgi:hypothetical protein